ncbi:hypothetical protein GF406_15755 [candidate division KSB1 bacterium]|nr:hypothetical protein [candidate division KSB1 bacterium]
MGYEFIQSVATGYASKLKTPLDLYIPTDLEGFLNLSGLSNKTAPSQSPTTPSASSRITIQLGWTSGEEARGVPNVKRHHSKGQLSLAFFPSLP